MRPFPLAPGLALAALVLAACDGGGSAAPPDHDRQAAMPPPVTVVDADGREPRRIAGDGLLPLARVLEIARRRVPGDIIKIELDDGDDEGEPEYELEILTEDGRAIEMKIDARRGAVLAVERD